MRKVVMVLGLTLLYCSVLFGEIIPECGRLLNSGEPEDVEVFTIVEYMPTFQGGDLTDFTYWVMDRIRYPQEAQEKGIEGRVEISFIVEPDGRISNLEVERSTDQLLTDEALRVIKQSPDWMPGKSRHRVVRVKYTVPVVFKLQ